MTSVTFTRIRVLVLAFAAGAAFALGAVAPAVAIDKDNPDWPCVWRKTNELDAATIWDGPALDKAAAWLNDDNVRKLSAFVISRRIKLDEVEASIKKFADAQDASARDQKLTELFAGVLSRTNDERKLVMSGIERFHKRQLARAKEIEKSGVELPKSDLTAIPAQSQVLTEKDVGEIKPPTPEEKFQWEVRIFQERQQNIPIACEIPQLMDERAGAVARAIRALMKS